MIIEVMKNFKKILIKALNSLIMEDLTFFNLFIKFLNEKIFLKVSISEDRFSLLTNHMASFIYIYEDIFMVMELSDIIIKIIFSVSMEIKLSVDLWAYIKYASFFSVFLNHSYHL